MGPTPIANESKNILKVSARIVSLVIPYLTASMGSPGAIIELAKGETKVYKETYPISFNAYSSWKNNYSQWKQ